MQRGILAALGVSGAVVARQVHGAEILTVEAPPGRYCVGPAHADGVATALPGVAAAVHVADCLPIAVGGAGAVAMLHGGWRGLDGGIVARGRRAIARARVRTGRSRRRSARAWAAAAMRPGTRCASASRNSARAWAGCSISRPWRRPSCTRPALRSSRMSACARCARPPERLFSHRRDGAVARAPGRVRVAAQLSVERGPRRARGGARARRARRGASGPRPRRRSRSCSPVKYVGAQDMPTLADAGVTLVGENRAQELLEKVATRPGAAALALHRRAPVTQGPR